jgi:hypothetical protein
MLMVTHKKIWEVHMKKVGLAKYSVIAVVLCLMMIATAGAGTATAKQDQNPSQAGKSSIYFYDVEPGETRGHGKLMIDVDKRTFVFNGQGFLPSAQLTLQSRAEDSTDYVVFAKGKATPSGNLHIAGTWEAAAPPAAVLLDYQEIVGFWLQNDAVFTAYIAYRYSQDGGTTWTLSSDTSGKIFGGYDSQTQYYDHDVPANALIKLKVEVVWGDDKSASEVFRAYPNACWGYYTVDGTTQNVSLHYNGKVCYE